MTLAKSDALRSQLNAVTRNTYCVNEKVPPSYRRQWKLHVLWRDGTTSTYWGDDTDAGFERVYRDALLDARRRGDEVQQSDGQADG